MISAKLAALSPEHQVYVLDFVEFLLHKYPAPGPKKSAEASAKIPASTISISGRAEVEVNVL